MIEQVERDIGGRSLGLEVGELAGLAGGAVTIRYGDTVLLATACVSNQPREGIDFLPLTVDVEERLYAIGKIPGSFFRREGRPTTDAILAARLTDRPIRPLLPKGFRNDVQLIMTVLSADRENDPDVLGTIGASAALCIAGAPFEGPVSSVRVGYIGEELVLNPTFTQLQESELDLVVAGTRDAIMMVEAGAMQVPERVMVQALEFGQRANVEIIDLQEQLIAKVGKPKIQFDPSELSSELKSAVKTALGSRFDEVVAAAKDERQTGLKTEREELQEQLGEGYDPKDIAAALEALIKESVREAIVERGVRPDGRGPNEIREISSRVGILPRTHGTGLFTRGETQVLTIATLGSTGEQQRLDNLSPQERKRFMHHYNFPPFSVGETRFMRGPARREIGHGALAERAIEPVIPSEDDFAYTIRLVSEVLSSNGSTSMASVCGSTLALMDAGVPIEAPVAGIAMGLVMGEGGKYQVLTDIAGMEDALGDMDFKVAGTKEGITALQMDIKVKGITMEIMAEALEQAREARLFILDKIVETIPEHRTELSKWAPRIYQIKIPVEKIGAVIGPGGRVIRSIVEETKCTIDVEDDGTVSIGSTDEEMAQKAMDIVKALTKEVEVGDIYTGKVVRIVDFGCFVEIPGGKDGLVRIGELANYHVPTVGDVVAMGDDITVKVIEIDSMGRINLSRKALLEGDEGGEGGAPAPVAASDGTSGDPQPRERREPAPQRSRFNDRPPRRPNDRGGDRGGFRGGGGRGRGDGGGGGGRRRGGGGGGFGGDRPGRPGGGQGAAGGQRPSNRPGPTIGPGPINQ